MESNTWFNADLLVEYGCDLRSRGLILSIHNQALNQKWYIKSKQKSIACGLHSSALCPVLQEHYGGSWISNTLCVNRTLRYEVRSFLSGHLNQALFKVSRSSALYFRWRHWKWVFRRWRCRIFPTRSWSWTRKRWDLNHSCYWIFMFDPVYLDLCTYNL